MSKKKYSQDVKRFAKQMASYATAAGLGAFCFTENAGAAVSFTDLPDISLLSLPRTIVPVVVNGNPFQDLNHRLQIDLNGDSINDMSVLLSFRRPTPGDPNAPYDPVGGDVSIKFNDFTLATPGTSKFLDKDGDTYYFLRGAFQLGDTIGLGGPDNVVEQDNAPYSDENQALLSYDYAGGSYVAQLFGSGFVGFKWDMTGAGTNFHYGWVEIETTANEALPGGVYSNAIVKGFAYETTPNTPILAGDIGGGSTAGDFDGDGDVDGRDFLIWQRGETSPPLDAGDLADWQNHYGTGTLTANMSVVPEPSSLALLMAGAGAMAFNRRRNLN